MCDSVTMLDKATAVVREYVNTSDAAVDGDTVNKGDNDVSKGDHIASGLSLALCRLNTLRNWNTAGRNTKGNYDTHDNKHDGVLSLTGKSMNGSFVNLSQSIFLISLTPDSASPLPMLTLSFSAQSNNVPISTLQLKHDANLVPDSVVLSQISNITNGVCMPPPYPKAVVKGGLACILVSIYLPQEGNMSGNHCEFIDWSVRVGKRVVDVGYVCGMCMKVYEEVCELCEGCGREVEREEVL